MVESMQNISGISTQFVLVWIAEAGTLRYVYAFISFVLYAFTMFVSSMIVYVTRTEETLHEPMYIFICGLVMNIMFGCSSGFPKIFIDFLCKNSTISLFRCLIQALCLQSYASSEICIFGAMAFDRYLAVGHALRYPTLMMNRTSIKLILSLWIFVSVSMGLFVLLTSRLTFCEVNIDNLFCETLSLQRLACGDTASISIFGGVWTVFIVIGCVFLIVYCYVKTIVICLKLSRKASQKATHTLVTHMLAFSTFMVGYMFITFRYRLSIGVFSSTLHVIIIVIGIAIPIILNPLIYGLRMEALRVKIIFNLQKCWPGQNY